MLVQRDSLALSMWVDILKEGLLPRQDPYVIVTKVVLAIMKRKMSKQLLLIGKLDVDQT